MPIVGIGASSGGLEAFIKFLGAMPARSGMALVFVPHLDPARGSIMSEVLARHSPLPVVEIEHGMALLPDRVHVIPSNHFLELRDGSAILSGPVQRGSPLNPLDLFLSSLASDQQDHAVAIILSGTGASGTRGAKAVKGSGGLVMAQSPESATETSMPQSVIDTGLADYILDPAQMPPVLAGYVARFCQAPPPDEGAGTAGEQMTEVLALLRARTRFDFHAYRKPMLWRRIERRMLIKNQPDMLKFVKLLQNDPEELRLLAKDLLISVTQFFRDAEMYEVLGSEVLPALLHERPADSTLRVWVPACATGEEAYSIAILLLEAMAERGSPCALQIFATDVDAEAIDVARRGFYPAALVEHLSPQRLAHYFIKVNGGYQVTKALRELMLFAQHNVLADAPFSKVDLISCRNLLIYLEPPFQQKLIGVFRFALKDDGHLVLGPSETIGPSAQWFEAVSRKWRVYRHKAAPASERIELPIAAVATRGDAVARRFPMPAREPDEALRRRVQQLLLDAFAPCAVLIRPDYEVLYFHGETDVFLSRTSGAPSNDLMSMVGDGLRAAVRAVVRKSLRERQRTSLTARRMRRNGHHAAVRISAVPVDADGAGGMQVLLSFEHAPTAKAGKGVRGSDRVPPEQIVSQIEDELRTTREELRGAIDELESTNEELTGANEEARSMNEELQSTNEEMESSKEELQSLNEELTTVNAQLQEKIDATEELNNDLTNLLASVDNATVFLDAELSIKRYTAAAARIYHLAPGDLGRPLAHIKSRVADPDFEADAARVLQTLAPQEREVASDDGRCYLRRLTTYRTPDNRIEGVVLNYTDVSSKQQALESLQARHDHLQGDAHSNSTQLRLEASLLDAVLGAVPVLVLVLDERGHISLFNQACEDASGYTADEVANRSLWSLRLIPDDEVAAVKDAVLAALAGRHAHGHVNRWRHRDGSLRRLSWSTTALAGAAGEVQSVVAIGVELADATT